MYSSPQLGPNVSIGEGVTVGEGVRLRESIVLHGATLQVGTRHTQHGKVPLEAGEGLTPPGSASGPFSPLTSHVLFGRSTHVFCTASWAGGAP